MIFWKKHKKTYFVSAESDDWVAPEETLLDSGSEYSDLEKPIPGQIFRFYSIIFALASLGLLSFVFKIAIVEHEAFAKLAFQNKSANFPLPPPRGTILDRNGQPLVRNVPVFNLLGITRELKENSENMDGYLTEISKIIGRDVGEFESEIKEEMRTSSTFFVHKDLNKDQALAIEYLEPKGFYVVPDTKRDYLDKNKTSHILGYIGKVNKEDLKDEYYFPIDVVGRLGVEAEYEEYLRGKHGNIFFSKGEAGFITKEPEPGKSIALNIDHDLQIKLHDELFAVLREEGLSGGAAIIQNPKTGAILALVSFPDYDNNVFVSGVTPAEYKRLFENRLKPLFNRIISGKYNPGSTIKPLIGMAALQEKVVTTYDTINDCISLTVPNPYHPENPYTFGNWRTEYGPFNLKKAIANSCNIYFFSVGGGHEKIKGLGAERIANYLKKSGADSVLGIDLPGEDNGFIPTPEWKLREKGEPWYLGDTYNTSIGQGDLLVTPLWLNSYISAIANGGNIYKPRISQAILDNNEIIQKFEPEITMPLPFSKEVIDVMRTAMRETVLSGTAQIFKELSIPMAAKTGTAEVQKGRTVNSLFTVFGPYDDPEISMTVLVEGSASNQGLAIRTAYNVLKWYLNR